MKKELIDELWNQATRYHFAKLVADAEAKRMQDEGMVTIGYMREQVAKEREACAMVCEKLPAPDIYNDSDKSMWDVTTMDCAEAIRARAFQ
jgi:hypothetical protein